MMALICMLIPLFPYCRIHEKKITQSFYNSPFHAPFFLFLLQHQSFVKKEKKMPLALRIKKPRNKINASLDLVVPFTK